MVQSMENVFLAMIRVKSLKVTVLNRPSPAISIHCASCDFLPLLKHRNDISTIFEELKHFPLSLA